MKYIASKLSYDQSFVFYTGTAPFAVSKVIVVKGGSNVRDPKTLVMPQGVFNGQGYKLSDEDAALIEADRLYKDFEKNGMMKLVNSKAGAKSAKKDLAEGDAASQLKESDYKKRGMKPPKAVKKGEDEEDEE